MPGPDKFSFDLSKLRGIYDTMRNKGYRESWEEFKGGMVGKDKYQVRKRIFDALKSNNDTSAKNYEDFVEGLRFVAPAKPKVSAAPKLDLPKPTSGGGKPADGSEFFGKVMRGENVSGSEPIVPKRQDYGGFDKMMTADGRPLTGDATDTWERKLVRDHGKEAGLDDEQIRRIEDGLKVKNIVADMEQTKRDAAKIGRSEASSADLAADASYHDETSREADRRRRESGNYNTQVEFDRLKNNNPLIKTWKLSDHLSSVRNNDEEWLATGEKWYDENEGVFKSRVISNYGNEDVTRESVDEVIGRLKKESEELGRKVEERQLELYGGDKTKRTIADAAATVTGGKLIYGMDPQLYYDDYGRSLAAAKRKIDERIETLEGHRDDPGFWAGVGERLSSRDWWTLGASDVADLSQDLALKQKIENGEELSDADVAYLRSSMYADRDGQFYGKRGFGNRAGKLTADAIPFVAEFIFTGGGMSALKGASKLGVKAATQVAKNSVKRAAAREAKELAADVTKDMTKGAAKKALGTRAKMWLLKNTGVVADDLARAGVMANTVGAGRTAGDAIGRYVGSVGVDDEGKFVYEGGVSAGEALLKAEVGNTLEYYTEMLGNHLKIGDWVAKGAEKIGAGKLSKAIKWAGSNKWLEKGGIQDLPSEGLEEEANIVLNSLLVGDNKLSDLWDGETQADIWGGMALSVGFMRSVAAAHEGYVWSRYKMQERKVERADVVAGYRFGDMADWSALKERIDGTTNEDMKGVVMSIMNDDGLHAEQKKAALDYVGSLMQLRGYNLGSVNDANDKEAAAKEAKENGDAGFVGAGEAETEKVEGDMEGGEAPAGPDAPTSNSETAALPGIDDGEQGGPVGAAFNRGREADEQERQDIAIELTDPSNVEAHEAWNGVVQRINEDADLMVAQQRAQTKEMQHKDGNVRPAILKEKDSEGNDQQVYIVDGNVEMMPDGSMVDKAASDNIVVVYNPATGERKQIDPTADDGISSLGEVTTAEQREADIELYRQVYVQAQIDEAQGTVRVVPGQQLVLPTGEEGVVVAIDADGEDITVALGDGRQATVQRSELQRIRDEKALADYRQRHGITEEPAAQQAEGYEPAQPQADGRVAGAPADYTSDMELTIRDEDGSEKPAMVMGRVRYENGSFVPDENGKIIEYYMDGEVKHAHEDVLSRDVVGYVAPHQTEAAPVEEASAGTPATVETTPPPIEQQAEVVPQPMQTGEPMPAQPAIHNADDSNLDITSRERVKDTDPMPVREDGEEDWQATTPERAHTYIFNEAGLSRSEGNEFIAAQIQAAQSALMKASSANMPKVGTSIRKYNEAKAKRQEKIDEAQRVLDYWNSVREIQNAIARDENERRAAEDAARHEEAVAQVQAEYEARKRAEAERKAVGHENPMPAITEKWDNATKVDGHSDEIMLPDGTALKGHYVLHESGASSPSHNPVTWQKTEGFPMDVNGGSVNDRDYERDLDAQEHTQRIAREYDQRALQNVPVVSHDGVVLSGNGRTMAGELAARDNTDGAYVNYLKEYAPKFGFTAEQVGAMQHPRVSFVPDEAMPYTAETFAKFNQQEMKSQNKTEMAVKLGKTVSDDSFKGIVRTINGYDTLGDFYNDADASLGAVYDLHNAGVVPQAQLAEMVDGVRGQEKLSAVGREFLENMLIGKAFEGAPDVVRMLTAEPLMRQTVITALGEIVDNIALGGGWSLQGELADAVKLCFDARQGGAKYGEIVSTYSRQGVLFADPDELQTVADFNNATMLMLADVLNDKRVTLLKTTLQLYNNNARESASGQADMFAGGVRSREDILRDVINFINENYGKRKEIEAARSAAVERRKAEGVQQDGDAEAVGGGSEATEEHPVERTGDRSVSEWFGPVYTQFEGKADEAEAHLRETTEGVAKGALTYPGVAPIDLVWGDMKAGYMKIVIKHPEVVGKLQSILSGTSITSQSDNRIVFESDTHKMIVSRMKGSRPTDNWLLTAYEKKEKPVSASSSDIETEPEGKRNGTATPQNGAISYGKGSDNPSTNQAKGEKVAENQSPSGVEVAVDAAERRVLEEEAKRTASHFPTETREEAAAFDRRVGEMSDLELLSFIKADGNGDVNKALHPSVYDEFDYRYGDEISAAYDWYLDSLLENGTTLEQAEDMLANIRRDKGRLATDRRAELLGQEDALQDYIVELKNREDQQSGLPKEEVLDGKVAEKKSPSAVEGGLSATKHKVNTESTVAQKEAAASEPTTEEGSRLAELRTKYPDRVFGERHENGSVTYYDEDAFLVSRLLGLEFDGEYLTLSKEEADKALEKLLANGHKAAYYGDEYKPKYDEYGNLIEQNTDPQPIGKGMFGNIYDQFRGRLKEAFDFLIKHKSGDLLGVFHRDGFGDIDLVWGDKGGGAEHIIDKHVGEGKSFATEEEAFTEIDRIIKTGKKDFENGDKVVFKDGNKIVTVRKNWREKGKKIADKNWVLTAYDETSADSESPVATNKSLAGSATSVSAGKVSDKSVTDKGDGGKVGGDDAGAGGVLFSLDGQDFRKGDRVSIKTKDAKTDEYVEVSGILSDKEKDGVFVELIDDEGKVLYGYFGDVKHLDKGKGGKVGGEKKTDVVVKTDRQGNPLNEDGSLKVEKIESVDELTDEDFSAPTRNVELPALPKNVDAAIGANGKPVIIKKNIFEKNKKNHSDLSASQSREILAEALYNPHLYGQNQKTTRPYNWILIHNAEKHSSVILEVSYNKDNVEIVNWHFLDDVTLKQKERQAVKEGGLILTLESAAGNTRDDLSSADKVNDKSVEGKGKGGKVGGELYKGGDGWIYEAVDDGEGGVRLSRYAGEEDYSAGLADSVETLSEEDFAARVADGGLSRVEHAFDEVADKAGGEMTDDEKMAAVLRSMRGFMDWDVKIADKRAALKAALDGLDDVGLEKVSGMWINTKTHEGVDGNSWMVEALDVMAAELKERGYEVNVGSKGIKAGDVVWGKVKGVGGSMVDRLFEVREVKGGNVKGVDREKGDEVEATRKNVMGYYRKTGGGVRLEKTGGGEVALTEDEVALCDAVVERLRDAGVDVVTDWEEGQRVIDEVNGDVRLQAKKRALETVSVTSNEAHQPTVVSSADGANVLKELDNVTEKYNNISNRINTFIGDVAKALGSKRSGSKSEYATFETKNGRIVTIRLADHNARVSTFDNRGELDGISIVVSPKKNGGIEADGEAHVVEYYYDAIKLRRADGKPLADIVRSIKQALYSGEFKDTTGLAEVQEVNGDVRLQTMMSGLKKASDYIVSFLGGKTGKRGVRVVIPERANRLAEQEIGHAIKSHYIHGNELKHARNRHGLNGSANNENSIPLRDEDFGLMPYIMASPTRVVKGSRAANGTESVRYEKELSNGVVIVVEREGRFDVEGMENITMWAQKKPATNVTVAQKASHSTSETIVISEADAAKIRKDAEDAISRDEKLRLSKVNGSVRLQKSAPVFYSNAERAVNGIGQKKATAEQWLAMIKKQGGIKAGEDKWLGLSDWLESRKGESLTKDEVLGFIRENRVEIEEVDYSADVDVKDNERMKELQQEFDELMVEAEEATGSIYTSELADWAFERMVDRYGDDFDTAFYPEVENGEGRLVANRDYDGMLDEAARYFLGFEEGGEIHPTRLDYTTDGLEHKKEIAFTVPTIAPWHEEDAIHFGDAGGGRAVAWVRFGETTDGEGRRVLVIDEIQSNRHQEGREKGYVSAGDIEAARNALAERELAIRKRMSEIDARMRAIIAMIPDDVVGIVARSKYRRNMPENEEYLRLDDEREALSSELSRMRREVETMEKRLVPDAPFEKNWHEMVMKRMLRYAAEMGYDKVAWTKGAQQAERYELGRQVDEIRVWDNSEGVHTVVGIKDGQQVFSRETQGGESGLAEVVGKDMARKAYSNLHEGGDGYMTGDGYVSLRGKDLSVGGVGMRGFYDEILPRFMDKYGKKWGVKTEDVELPKLLGSARVMHAVDVTDAMKESVMEGQPMFFRTKDGRAYGFVKDGRIYIDPRIATAETPIHEYCHLWASAMRDLNPKEWRNIVELMKGTAVWDDVKRLYPELKTDDAIGEEVLAHYSGRRGAERLRAEQEKILGGNGDVLEKAAALSAIGRVKEALKRFWKGVADWFGIHFTSAEEVADKVLSDLLNGVNPVSAMKSERGGVRYEANSEEAGIVASAKADGTYMKAPNGKASKLSPSQWVQVRTRAFKEWFGDWEKRARIEKLRNSEPIVRKGDEYKGRYELNSRSAEDYVIHSLRGEYPNNDTGDVIRITRASRKVAHHDAENEVHLRSIAYIPEMIKNAVFIEERVNEKSGRFDSYRYYVVGLKIGGVDYTAKLVVGVKGGESYYDHSLTEIEKNNLIDLTDGVKADVSGNEAANFTGKDKRLLSILQTNSSKVVDENGEPRVVYHGRSSNFNSFGKQKGSRFVAGVEIDSMAEGFFFTPNKDLAESFSYNSQNLRGGKANVLSCFLNVRTPLDLVSNGFENRYEQATGWEYNIYMDSIDNMWEMMDVEGVSNILKSKGYDGVLFAEKVNEDRKVEKTSICVLSPTQIKSATENVGTFDGSNPDIRYQFVGEKGAAAMDRAEERSASLASETEDVAREDQIFWEDGLGVSMSESASETDLDNVNRRFNADLGRLTEENKDNVVLSLGRPSAVLLSAGVEDKPMKLYGNKVIKKMKKHGFALSELQGLPRAVADPIAVFDNYQLDGNRTVLTELQSKGKNIMVAVTLGKDGVDVDFNIVSSVFGKGENNIVDWLNKGYARYINKEKALNYLHHSDRHISEALSNPRLVSAAKVVEDFVNPMVVVEENDVEDSARYRIREDEPPTKTGIGYKVFVLKDGKLYPPMVANPGGEATPVGVWLDADAAPVAGVTKTGRQQVKAGGKGTQGGSGKLSYRPGWHLGEIPYALQFNRLNPETGQRELFPANFVWAEVEYANDVDYQEEAMSYGMNASGKFQHSLAGLPRLPENGSYRYRTNPDPSTDPWVITGAMKVNRILKPSEVDAMVEAAGREPQQRQAGAVTDEQVDALNATVKRTMQEDRDMMRSAVEQMGEKLHTDINIIEDVNEITHPNAAVQERRRKSKGWYDTSTGQVNIVLDNNRDVDDVKASVGHETIAHKGLRELVGEENYDEFLDETYQHLRDDLKQGVDAAAGRAFVDDATKNGKRAKSYEQHRRTAVDELFGRMAEKPFEEFTEGERTLWQKLKAAVRKLLDKFLGTLKLPKWFELGDNELRYILWRSKERLERGREHPIDLARDIVKREELGLTDEARYNMGDAPETFKSRQKRAVENKGTVMPGLNGAQVKVVDVPRHHYTGNIAEATRQAIEAAKTKFAPNGKARTLRYDNFGATFDYSISGSAVEESLNPKQQAKSVNKGVHIAMAEHLDEIIGQSIEVEEHPDYLKNEKGERDTSIINDKALMHRFYGAVVVDGVPYRVMTLMREEKNPIVGNGIHAYEVQKIEVLDETPNTPNGVGSHPQSEIGSSYPLAKLLQNVGKSYEKDKNLLDESKLADESTDLYREGDDVSPDGATSPSPQQNSRTRGSAFGSDDIWTDGSMGLQERMTAAATRLANNHREDKTLRNDAMRAIGGNLADLRKAMSLQRTFDRTTVKRVADLARVLITNGYINNATSGEIKRLLSVVKNSVGHNDIEGDVQKVMDIMVDNQLKHAEETLHELEAIKGSKVDARGVEVQGQLDAEGQTLIKSMKEAQKIVNPCGGKTHDENGEPTAWGNALESAIMRMSSNDQAVAEEAALEYAGMQMAQQWFDTIQQSKLEEQELRQELKSGYVDDSGTPIDDPQGKREWRASIEEAIRQNKIERVQAYYELVGRLTDSLRESLANAKDFKEAEKQRVREIQHNANSDMEGRPDDEHQMPANTRKKVNNWIGNSLFAPLATYMEMLRLFGRKSANGEGYLFNRFGRGWIDARQQEIRGVRDKYAILDAKAAELFGGQVKTWGDLIRRVGKLPKGTVSFWNGGEMQEREMTQGNLMYIYMVNKMLDGRMKLRKMGISEEDVAEIERVLDPRLIELADWMQDEFLVQTRNEYNETHKRMFGASMAAIEHYFPLRVLKNAIDVKAEDLDKPEVTDGISTITGGIIKRRRNSKPLDILNADALHVILSHVAEMEHWNAYAEFNRDLNTLRSYRHFRNQVQNMNTIYGNGKNLWEKFNDVCQMATGAYKPKGDGIEKAILSAAQGVTAAKVAFRIFTALKQFASLPAYFPYVRADYLVKSMARPDVSWSWCMEHLPIFEERWKSRVSGDPRLAKSILTAADWRQNLAVKVARAGMAPNAFVDALTVSMGAYAVYQTRKGQYLRDGYSEEQAERRAIQDTEMVYNETQQSGESAFTSTMQTDRTWWKVMFSVFRNSSMAYQRQLHGALRDLGNIMKEGGVSERLAFMKKQMIRDGLSEEQADAASKRRLRRQLVKDGLAVATFGYIMQLAWNMAGYLPYLLFGDDDETKDEFWDDIWAHTMGGWLEGLTGGDVMSLGIGMWLNGEVSEWKLKKEMPLTTDLFKTGREFFKGEYGAFVTDAVNLCVQMGLGMNPQSITDGVLAIMDACGDDPALAHEATICISRILQVPQSQIDKMYFDEVGLSGDEVSKYTPAQLAERYAEFKVKRGRFFAPWSWDDEDQIGKYIEKANKTINERTEQMGDKKVNEAYLQYEEVYKGVDAKVNEAKKKAKTDYVEAAQLMAEARSDSKAFETYQMFKPMDGYFNEIVKLYLGAKTPDEAALCRQAVLDYKSAMVKVLEAPDVSTRDEAIDSLRAVMQDFDDAQSRLRSAE